MKHGGGIKQNRLLQHISDAFFWVGTGPKPNQEGAQVPDENGKTEPLRRYDTKTLVLTLPGDLTVFDVEWLSVWCKAYGIDFGHIRIPKNLNVPPSLKMLGVAPQVRPFPLQIFQKRNLSVVCGSGIRYLHMHVCAC